MIDIGILFSLFSLGLVSGAHCIGMCGGIMGALTMAIPAEAKSKRWFMLVAYNLGRILSYSLMGLLAGLFAEQFSALGGGTLLRILAGILLISMGLYLANWWQGLTKLETLGRYLWAYIQPIGKRLMPVDTITKALLLGALWGWLPCGLVYAALAMAMTQPAPFMAASAMLAFGLGTLPAVLAAGAVAQQLAYILQQRAVRSVLAIIIIVFGFWTIWGALGHSHQHHHDQSHEQQHTQHPAGSDDHSVIGAGISQIDRTHADHLNMDHSSLPNTAIHDLERQRTEGDIKIKEHKSSSASSLAADKNVQHMHHH